MSDRAVLLPTPDEVRRTHPLSARGRAAVLAGRAAVRAARNGRDPRLVVIVGPCSLHDPDAALEYADRLAALAQRCADRLIIVMRTYFEKPRTIVGWKGLINDPHLDGSCDVGAGLSVSRALLTAIADRGLACSTELLDPLVRHYLADGLAWVAIGARTTESQIHREMASGLPMPVGFKNTTGGNIAVAGDAVRAAARPHHFPGVDPAGRPALLRTRGNPDGHIVLRGGDDRPNYFPEDIAHAAKRLADCATRPVLVDCNHANSGKNPRAQTGICRAVLEDANPGLLGVMLESHLHEGRQDWRPGAENRYGVSITDPCMGWAETEALLSELASAGSRRKVA